MKASLRKTQEFLFSYSFTRRVSLTREGHRCLRTVGVSFKKVGAATSGSLTRVIFIWDPFFSVAVLHRWSSRSLSFENQIPQFQRLCASPSGWVRRTGVNRPAESFCKLHGEKEKHRSRREKLDPVCRQLRLTDCMINKLAELALC